MVKRGSGMELTGPSVSLTQPQNEEPGASSYTTVPGESSFSLADEMGIGTRCPRTLGCSTALNGPSSTLIQFRLSATDTR